MQQPLHERIAFLAGVDAEAIMLMAIGVGQHARGGAIACRVVVGWTVTLRLVDGRFHLAALPLRKHRIEEGVPHDVVALIACMIMDAHPDLEVAEIVRGTVYNEATDEVRISWADPQEH